MNKFTLLVGLLSWFILLGNLSSVKANAPYYYYQELGIKEGLSHSKVQCILSDHKGHLWIGTEHGLNRYDGNRIKHYLMDKEESTGYPYNVLFLEEDSLNNLWVGTPSGVYLFDRSLDEFTLPIINNRPIFSTSVLSIEGGVIFSEPGIIYRYSYEKKEIEVLYSSIHNNSGFITFWEMLLYNDETILLNSRWHGIYFFNLERLELSKADHFTGGNYTSVYLDSHNHLWVAAYGEGLYCYDKDQVINHFTSSNSPLTYDVIHDVIERDNQLWVATDGGGINIIALDDFSFHFMPHNKNALPSDPLKTVHRLYLDPLNNVWAGTIRKGMIGIKNVYGRSFQEVPFGYDYGLSNPVVNCLYQESDGTVWIGTDGGGINQFDPKTEKFKHFASTKEDKVVSIINFTSRHLLFSSFNKGVFLFDKQTGVVTPFILKDQETNDLLCKSGYSVFLQRISDHEILFSSSQLLIYNIVKNTYETIAHMGVEFERNSPTIIATHDDITYLADQHNIVSYNAITGDVETIYQGVSFINNAHLDEKANFWMATNEGLHCFELETGNIRKIETPIFNEAISVISDTHERIWVGTRRDLYIYSPSNESFVDLGEADGVSPNEYLPNASLLSANGDLLFGGTIGLTLINSHLSFNTGKESTIEVLEVLLDGQHASLYAKEGEKFHTVRIPWHFTSLQVNVLLKDSDIFRKNRFRFHLEGKNMELSKTSSNQLIINHFPVGNYTVTASYFMRSGQWSDENVILHVIVTPPWWETTWFRILVFILIGIMVGGIIYYFSQKSRAKQRQEIARLRNSLNEEKITLLTNISHELRTPLTLIYAPLKRIIDRKVERDTVEDHLHMIYSQSQQMMNILDTVLDVRKLEEGKDLLTIRMHDINKWIKMVGDKFAVEFKEKGITIHYMLDSEIDTVPFDKDKCEFVVSNFLMNALKFSEAGATVTISTQFAENKKAVRVSVQDQGIGLETVDPGSLFTNFYQGTHYKGGSGIGLSYAKSLITLHKGRIGAMDAPGRGSIFYFELPLDEKIDPSVNLLDEHPDIPVKNESKIHLDYRYFENLTVIIVEDTAELREYLKTTLNTIFKHIYTAKNGLEGLKLIKGKQPDIIISDVMMPEMNGFELCQKVKSNIDISHIPFILLTAYGDPKNMQMGYKTGADAFLSKPFDIETLLALIYNQVKVRERVRERYQKDSLTPKEISFSNADETFLIKFNAVIEENMSDTKLDVPFLASKMFMSRSLLFNKVKAITGMGIVDYINKQRVEKSIVLLTTTRFNISEISDIIGFSSPRYFSRVFKSHKGVSPSEYRKE